MNDIPEGYMRDAKGRLVPREMVKDVDLARDELVREIVAKAREVNATLAKFKAGAFADIEAFLDLSAERYGAKLGGAKGNVSLASFDGKYRVQRAVAEHLAFDERLQAAKALIDECIHAWTEGSRAEIRALVNDAFQVDKEGKVSTGRILGLRRLDIDDEKWLRAMKAIGDSVRVVGSKTYIRIYVRDDVTGEDVALPLDVATA